MSRLFSHAAHSHVLHLPSHVKAEVTLADTIPAQAEVTAVEDPQRMVEHILHQADSDLHHLHLLGGMAEEEAWNDTTFIGREAHLLVPAPRVVVHDPTHQGRDHLHQEDEADQHADPAHRVVGDVVRVIAVTAATVIGAGAGAGVEVAAVTVVVEGGKGSDFQGDLLLEALR
jgi:hypothetical protein